MYKYWHHLCQGSIIRSPYSIINYLLLLLFLAGKSLAKSIIYKLFAAKSDMKQPTYKMALIQIMKCKTKIPTRFGLDSSQNFKILHQFIYFLLDLALFFPFETFFAFFVFFPPWKACDLYVYITP